MLLGIKVAQHFLRMKAEPSGIRLLYVFMYLERTSWDFQTKLKLCQNKCNIQNPHGTVIRMIQRKQKRKQVHVKGKSVPKV